MKRLQLLILAGLLAGLIGAAPAAADGASIRIYSTAVCKAEATVVLAGTATSNKGNRIEAYLYYKNDKGEEMLLAKSTSTSFGAGSFLIGLTLPYTASAQENAVLRLEVRLQEYRTGGGKPEWSTVSQISQDVTVADKYCHGECRVIVDTIDKAPVDGTLTLRSHFGTWFRPEGWLEGAVPVAAGQKVHAAFADVKCNWPVRVWYYPKSGSKTPFMLPAQSWPKELPAYLLGDSNPYTAAFANRLKPTYPLEEDDPFVAQ